MEAAVALALVLLFASTVVLVRHEKSRSFKAGYNEALLTAMRCTVDAINMGPTYVEGATEVKRALLRKIRNTE